MQTDHVVAETFEEAKAVFCQLKNWFTDILERAVREFDGDSGYDFEENVQQDQSLVKEGKSQLEEKVDNLKVIMDKLILSLEKDKNDSQNMDKILQKDTRQLNKLAEKSKELNQRMDLLKTEVDAFCLASSESSMALVIKCDSLESRLSGLEMLEDRIFALENRLKLSEDGNALLQDKVNSLKTKNDQQKIVIEKLQKRISELIIMEDDKFSDAVQDINEDEILTILDIPVKIAAIDETNSSTIAQKGQTEQQPDEHFARLLGKLQLPYSSSEPNPAQKEINSQETLQNSDVSPLNDLNPIANFDASIPPPPTFHFSDTSRISGIRSSTPEEIILLPFWRWTFNDLQGAVKKQIVSITNKAISRVAFVLNVNSVNGSRCSVDVEYGIIAPNDTVNVTISRPIIPLDDESPSVSIEWIPISSRAPNVFNPLWFQDFRSVRRKVLPH